MRMDWLGPWCEVESDAVAESLRAELVREVPVGHVLHGVVGVRAIGYRKDRDDVAFALADGRVAVVHLTWGRTEAVWPDPSTEVLESVEAFGRRVEEDHRDWG